MQVNVPYVTAALALAGRIAFGQVGVLTGSVSSDSLGKRQIVGAELTIPALALATTSNFAGEYRFDGLGAGRYLVIVQAFGYKSIGDSVTVAAAGETYHDFVLATRSVVLDSIVAKAPMATRTHISPGLNAFETRRAEGFGHFIPEDTLRKYETQSLSNLILPRMPGIRMVPGSWNGAYLASSRTTKICGSVMGNGTCPTPPRGGGTLTPACYATVYLDGILVYDLLLTTTQRPPNINDFAVSDLAGVEFYPGEATAPPGFRQSGCGLLVLWTRER